MRPLRFESLAIRHLRNLAKVDLAPAPRLNVIAGDNGQGKTSILEAAYLACTSRSFRTTKLGEIVAHGERIGSAKAVVVEGEERREQTVGLEGAKRRVTLDGKRPTSLASFAVRSPVVAFHPAEMTLSSGPASSRRTLLDRLALFVDPSSMDHFARYATATRSRQRVLEQRGPLAPELAAFERLMALHGAALTGARAEAARRIVSALTPAFARITEERRSIEASYAPGGPAGAAELEAALLASRERDRHRGSASVGPHKDDLAISIDGFGARSDASQGEHRAITLALKLAELGCIAEARGVWPVLLLDDVSSELDATRTASLFGLLGQTPGQIFLTTTRPELIETGGLSRGDRRDFTVVGGELRDRS